MSAVATATGIRVLLSCLLFIRFFDAICRGLNIVKPSMRLRSVASSVVPRAAALPQERIELSTISVLVASIKSLQTSYVYGAGTLGLDRLTGCRAPIVEESCMLEIISSTSGLAPVRCGLRSTAPRVYMFYIFQI